MLHARRHAPIANRLAARHLGLAALAAGVLSGAPRDSLAQHPRGEPARPLRTAWAGATPRVTFNYHDLFDNETLRRMRSGLEVTVVMRTWATPDGTDEAVGFGARSCRVSYDVWEEHYAVEVLDPDGLRTVALPTIDAVLAQCAEVNALPLRMSRPFRPAERYHIATVAEVDPLTPDMVVRIQRWVARPGEAAPTPTAPESSFFGSFVALFVNPTIGEAERTVRFDSGPQVAP